jgi:protein-L-isoaspartate(D-aspartate) O-methyltransferase
MLEFQQARRNMVDCQLRTCDVTDQTLLAAFETVPRERFVPEAARPIAYLDRSLLVWPGDGGEAREMPAPMVIAKLLQAARPGPGQKVLDVACGLGYSSAILVELGCAVTALESIEPVAAEARRRLAAAGYASVAVRHGDLAKGVADAGPFDLIAINGACEVRPDGLLALLAPGGRLACVLGSGRAGRAVLYVENAGEVSEREVFDAAAPPLAAFRKAPAFAF